MVPTCRVLPFGVADGPDNMAADEALLDSAANGAKLLRLYGWTRPTLSLGYFQPAALRESDALLAAIPFVRRCTGGETLVHHHELTYALAVPAGAEWLCHMHGIIAAALAEVGVKVQAVCTGEEKKIGDVLCFLHHTRGDLVCQGAKIVGSAQRKRRGALLQHGAILLAQSRHTPALPGVRELAGFHLGRVEELKTALLQEFARDTGWQLEPGDWTAGERAHITELEGKYTGARWNCKR
jgi:lipoate-protein ligase A